MTTKETIFVSEYLKSFNATQSAINAGYSEKTAGVIGFENLKKPHIQEAIKAGLEEIIGPNERIVKENVELWRAIMVDPEAKPNEKLKASELIGKYAMMFVERQEISGPGGGPIKTETTHDLSKLSTEELRKLDEILSKA